MFRSHAESATIPPNARPEYQVKMDVVSNTRGLEYGGKPVAEVLESLDRYAHDNAQPFDPARKAILVDVLSLINRNESALKTSGKSIEFLRSYIQILSDLIESKVAATPTIKIEVDKNPERTKYRVFWLFMDELRSVIDPNLGVVTLPTGERRDISFDTDPPAILREFIEHFQRAMLRLVKRKVVDDSTARGFPPAKVEIMKANIFGFSDNDVRVEERNLTKLLDAVVLPERLRPVRDIMYHRFVSYSISLDRAALFTEILANPQGKDVKTVTNKWDSMSSETGGFTYYDTNALYQTNVDSNVLIEDKTKAKELLGEDDETWHLGAILNFFIARMEDLVFTDPDLSHCPWTLNAGNRQKLEKRLKEELVTVFPSADELDTNVALECAFWHFRSSGEEMKADPIARDNRLSRMMNLRRWVGSAIGKALIREEFLRRSIAKRFEVMAISQEEFASLTATIPKKALIPVDYVALSEDDKKTLKSQYGITTPGEVIGKVRLLKIDPSYQQWAGAARAYSKTIILPEDMIFQDPSKAENLQLHMTVRQMRASMIDTKYVDFYTLTTSLNKKYVNTIEYLRTWFEEYGRMSHEKVKELFKPIESSTMVGAERTAMYTQSIVELFNRVGISWGQLLTMLSRPIPLEESSHGHHAPDPRIESLRTAAKSADAGMRKLIHVPPPDAEDFKEYGFAGLLHHTTDYLLDEFSAAGGQVRVMREDGTVNLEPVHTLHLLRRFMRSMDGSQLPQTLETALSQYSRIGKLGRISDMAATMKVDASRIAAQQQEATDLQQRAKNNAFVGILSVAIDMYLDQYTYEHSPFLPTVGSHAEIKTASGLKPMDFIERQKFIKLVVYFMNSLQVGEVFSQGFDSIITEEWIVWVMEQKGIIGSPEQLVVDTRTFNSDKFKKVPTRFDRLKVAATPEAKH